MTLVAITLTVPDGQVGNPEAPAVGTLQWRPWGPGERRKADSPAREVLPAPFDVALLPGATTVEVAPTVVGWCWRVTERIVGLPDRTRYLLVPDAATVDYRDLQEVNPRTLAPTAAPPAAWTVALGDNAITDTEILAALGGA